MEDCYMLPWTSFWIFDVDICSNNNNIIPKTWNSCYIHWFWIVHFKLSFMYSVCVVFYISIANLLLILEVLLNLFVIHQINRLSFVYLSSTNIYYSNIFFLIICLIFSKFLTLEWNENLLSSSFNKILIYLIK